MFDSNYFGLVRRNQAELKSDNWLYARGAPTRAVSEPHSTAPLWAAGSLGHAGCFSVPAHLCMLLPGLALLPRL